MPDGKTPCILLLKGPGWARPNQHKRDDEESTCNSIEYSPSLRSFTPQQQQGRQSAGRKIPAGFTAPNQKLSNWKAAARFLQKNVVGFRAHVTGVDLIGRRLFTRIWAGARDCFLFGYGHKGLRHGPRHAATVARDSLRRTPNIQSHGEKTIAGREWFFIGRYEFLQGELEFGKPEFLKRCAGGRRSPACVSRWDGGEI